VGCEEECLEQHASQCVTKTGVCVACTQDSLSVGQPMPVRDRHQRQQSLWMQYQCRLRGKPQRICVRGDVRQVHRERGRDPHLPVTIT